MCLWLHHTPRWGSLQCSPDPLAGLRGPTSEGKEREGEGKEGEWEEGVDGKRREGEEGRDGLSLLRKFLDLPLIGYSIWTSQMLVNMFK